jgi:hypothetical protein
VKWPLSGRFSQVNLPPLVPKTTKYCIIGSA